MNGNAFNKLRIRPLPWELKAFTSDIEEQGEAFTIRQKILEQWKTPEEAAKARGRIIAELEEAGFEGAAEQLNDEQAIEVATALRISQLS